MAVNDQQLLARWSGSISDPALSPVEFYEIVEQTITESGIRGISFSTFTRREGGFFSPFRIYLRIRLDEFFFDICAFVSGRSFVVSYWLHIDCFGIVDLLAEIPGIGFLIKNTSRPATYYSIDFVEHFQREVHKAILQVVDEVSEMSGGERLPPEARPPIWEQLW